MRKKNHKLNSNYIMRIILLTLVATAISFNSQAQL